MSHLSIFLFSVLGVKEELLCSSTFSNIRPLISCITVWESVLDRWMTVSVLFFGYTVIKWCFCSPALPWLPPSPCCFSDLWILVGVGPGSSVCNVCLVDCNVYCCCLGARGWFHPAVPSLKAARNQTNQSIRLTLCQSYFPPVIILYTRSYAHCLLLHNNSSHVTIY